VTPRSEPHGFVQIQTTLDDRDQAEALIRGAVEHRVAACGQLVGPIRSTYWWKGRIETAEEWLCLFKATAVRSKALEEWIRSRHPYEVPEIVTLDLAAVSDAYGEWIEDETSD
jgi:periplasmic divalent cation tolerance protein